MFPFSEENMFGRVKLLAVPQSLTEMALIRSVFYKDCDHEVKTFQSYELL